MRRSCSISCNTWKPIDTMARPRVTYDWLRSARSCALSNTVSRPPWPRYSAFWHSDEAHRQTPGRYLTGEEIQALLDAPAADTLDGVRDRAMLHLAYCAGLRVRNSSAYAWRALSSTLDCPSMCWAKDAVSAPCRCGRKPRWHYVHGCGSARQDKHGDLPQRAREGNYPLRVRVCVAQARPNRRRALSNARGKAHPSPCAEALMRNDDPAGDRRYTQSSAMARARQYSDDGNLLTRRHHGLARSHERGHATLASQGTFPSAGSTDHALEVTVELRIMWSGEARQAA